MTRLPSTSSCDRVLDAIEIRPVLLPVIEVSGHLDLFVGLEADEFEWAGADRILPHVARRHVAGIDRRESRGQCGEKRRLRPLQMKGNLVVAPGADPLEVAVPG